MLTTYVQQNKINVTYNDSELENDNTINDSKNTAFVKPSFYGARDSLCYLLLDLDILENIVDHPQRGWLNLDFVICRIHKEPLAVIAQV